MQDQEQQAHAATRDILRKVAKTYKLSAFKKLVDDDNSLLFKKDIYICLKNIVAATQLPGDVKVNLREARNIYKAQIFLCKSAKEGFLIKHKPDFNNAIKEMKKYKNCFALNGYSIVNTFTSIVEAQVTGFKLDALRKKADKHLQTLIKDSLKNNPNWNKKTLKTKKPKLIMPVGAAGCGKSTFYRELSNVVNISCDNIRYLLFGKNYGPSFCSWENCLAWWAVNQVTDEYLLKGYNVFYNGVNTDLEYRSPVTMENPDPLFTGMPYRITIVYFEPLVKLDDAELAQLKGINLWQTPIDQVNVAALSPNVARIIDMIKTNFNRTLQRTKEISEGTRQQNPYDVLYMVPAPIVKLFVEQSFAKPTGPNVVVVPRKEIPDETERAAFYRHYADQAMK